MMSIRATFQESPPHKALPSSTLPGFTLVHIGSWQAALLVALLAGSLRLYHIADWPLFTDEDGYSTAALASARASGLDIIRPMFLTHKPPLLLVLHGQMTRLTDDPVIAGRLLSAVFGTITAVLCLFLGRRLGGPAVGLVAAALYAVSPLAVLHERMVLYDGVMTTLVLGTLLMSWSAVEHGSWPIAGVAALLGALAVQVKQPAVGIAVMPLLFLLVYPKALGRRLGPAVFAAVGPLISLSVIPVMRLPSDPQVAAHLSPFIAVQANMEELLGIIGAYFPAGLPFLILAGMVIALRHNPRLTIVLLVPIAIWSLPQLVLGAFAPSRYYLPAVPIACAFAALAMVRLTTMASMYSRATGGLVGFAALIIIATCSIAAIHLVTSHHTAAMSKLDDWQYRSGWASGYGYAEAAKYVATSVESGAAVAYMVPNGHRTAAGIDRRPPTGVISLGLVTSPADLRPDYPRSLYLLLDDDDELLLQSSGRETAGTGRLSVRDFLVQERQFQLLVRFARPGSDKGVSILRHERSEH